MLRDRPPGSVSQSGHAEIRQLAPFELRRPFDQSLGWFIDAKPKPFFPLPSSISVMSPLPTGKNAIFATMPLRPSAGAGGDSANGPKSVAA